MAFRGNAADLLDESEPAHVIHSKLEGAFLIDEGTPTPEASFAAANSTATATATARNPLPRKGSKGDRATNSRGSARVNVQPRAESVVDVDRTLDVGVQTEYMGDLSDMPSAHDDRLARHGIRADNEEDGEGHAPLQARKSHWSIRNNKVHPEAVQLDAPRRLQARENIRRKLGFFGLLLYDFKHWLHLKRTQRRDPVPVWRKSIKTIEGQFGSGYASFFVFLRWLFLVNLSMSLVWLALVVLPNIIVFDYGFYIQNTFSIDQLISGRGAVGDSWLFYGAYSSRAGSYRMDVAYLGVLLALLAACALLIIHTMVFALSPIHSRGTLVNTDKKSPYSMMVFTTFDHAINSAVAVRTLQQGLTSAVRDALHEGEAVKADTVQTFGERWKKRGIRIVGWLVYFGILAGSFLAVWYVIQAQDTETTGFSAYSSVIVFSVINSLAPMVISVLVKLEKYNSAKTELMINIGRSAVLRTLSIYAVLYGLYKKTGLLNTQSPTWSASVLTPQSSCAGTVFGQELYRLLVIDTLTFSLSLTAFHVLMYNVWYRRKNKLEMDIPEGVLSIVYRQGIVWVGMVFCPVLPIVGLLSNGFIFFVYYQLVKRTCRPPEKRWTQNRHNVFFFVFLLIMMVVLIIPLNIALQGYKPNCGPYGDPKYTSVYGSFSVWLDEQSSPTQTAANVVTNSAFIVPVLVALGAVIYYHRVRLSQWKHHHHDLLRELDQLRADKKFLLARVKVDVPGGGAQGKMVDEDV